MKLGTFSKVCSSPKTLYYVWNNYPYDYETLFKVDYLGDIDSLSDSILEREKHRSYNVVDVHTTSDGVMVVIISKNSGVK